MIGFDQGAFDEAREKFKFMACHSYSQEFANDLTFDQAVDFLFDTVMVQMTFNIVGVEEHYAEYIDIPNGRLANLRLALLPNWFNRRWPPRYKTDARKVFRICPHGVQRPPCMEFIGGAQGLWTDEMENP